MTKTRHEQSLKASSDSRTGTITGSSAIRVPMKALSNFLSFFLNHMGQLECAEAAQ
ncbi:hypothetical protein [Pseudomonas sp. 2FE]|uniref:hypothetical protein n=1 Tax=Pseudomonas sp. 2FE TaxID=2502190 RepID=UPI0014858BDB|nr:hypothetical protein [Pseudomonas sp. 2FE]